ncbi:MAG: 50S ribosomal protein L15 [Phycisphaerae bacterium]|nr:50S ribosomal protein L15 [Phycisphaerae bacterium]
MSSIHEITAEAGARHRRKRVGRGRGSGHGKTCGRGTKGCQSRAGGGVRPLTEGGQMPLFRRVAKRGFNNFNFRTEYEIVNLDQIEKTFTTGGSVNIASLRQNRLIRGAEPLVKVLGRGAVARRYALEVHAVSGSAREAIEKAGGSVTLIERRDPAAAAKAKRNSAKGRPRPKPQERRGRRPGESSGKQN